MHLHAAHAAFGGLGFTRSIIGLLTLLGAFSLLGCAKDPTRPATERIVWSNGAIDKALAWSRDGQWIAFRRRVPSAYGPPGMYVVHRTGSIVRFVHGPEDSVITIAASFSPDGRRIAALNNGQLLIVDILTLESRRPLYTQSAIQHPDWSPDGRNILHSRFVGSSPAITRDSIGLFAFDVTTGENRQVGSNPSPIVALEARWSPDGRLIAMCELVESALALSVVNADGTGHRYLIPPRSLQQYEDIDWYRPVPGGAMKILFRRSRQPNGARFLINPDGTGLTPFWHRLDFEAFLSPTGAEFVREHPDPVSHFPVLYVGLVDDLTDVSLRQLTHYEPQASEVFTETQGDRHASEAGLSVDSVR